MKLYLIRHGETEYNRRHLYYGKTDVSLNKKGIQQSFLLREKLVRVSLNVPVYTSSLKRTIETAKVIFPRQRKISMRELDEKDFGLWEGLNANQINQKFPDEWNKWLESPFEITPPNAENFSNFQNRILKCLKKILREQQDFVLVGHLGVLRIIIRSFFPEYAFWEITLDQGNYTLLEIKGASAGILLWNK